MGGAKGGFTTANGIQSPELGLMGCLRDHMYSNTCKKSFLTTSARQNIIHQTTVMDAQNYIFFLSLIDPGPCVNVSSHNENVLGIHLLACNLLYQDMLSDHVIYDA